MTSATFTCPECDAALRGADKLPAGKKVKCPSCSAIFVMPERKQVESSEAVRDNPLPPAPARPIHDDRGEEAPRPKRQSRDGEDKETPPRRGRSRDDEETEDGAPRRRKGQAAAADDVVTDEYVDEEYREEDDEVEDQPRKKKRKKKKTAGRGGKRLLIGLIAGGAFLVLGGGFLLIYFIFLYGTNSGGGDEDPLAYIPPDCNVIIGMDLAALADENALGRRFRSDALGEANGGGLFDQFQKKKQVEPADFEQVILGLKIDSPQGGGGLGPAMPMGVPPPGPFNILDNLFPPLTMIVRYKKSFNQKYEAQTINNATRVMAEGKYYYEVPDPWMKTLYMPSNRLAISTSLRGSQLEPLLKSDGKKLAISTDTAAAIHDIEKNTIWAYVPMEGKLRTDLEARMARDPPPAALGPLVDCVLKCRGVSFWGKLEPDRMNLGLGLKCADSNTSSQLISQMEAGGNQVKGQMVLELLLGGRPQKKQLVDEIKSSLQFSAQGSTAQVTASITRSTLKDAFSEGILETLLLPAGGGVQPGGGAQPGGGMGKGGRGKGGGLN